MFYHIAGTLRNGKDATQARNGGNERPAAERQRLLESKEDQLERKKQELVSLTRSRLLKKIYGIDGKASDFDKRITLMY